jgi:hypothetical protein
MSGAGEDGRSALGYRLGGHVLHGVGPDVLEVAVERGDAVARRRDIHPVQVEFGAVEAAEQFAGLLLHLLLFAADVGDGVVEDLHRGDAGVAGTRDGLQGRDVDPFEPEPVERGERRDHRDGRAVRVLQERAVPAALVALDLDEVDVFGVHLGDDERDGGGHPGVRGVRGDDVARLGEAGFDRGTDRGGERGEQQWHVVRNLVGVGRPHGHLADAVGDGDVESPLGGVVVAPAGRVLAGGQRGDLEVGVWVEELDESLAHGARRAEDAYADAHCHG